jgi:hypothetical protein
MAGSIAAVVVASLAHNWLIAPLPSMNAPFWAVWLLAILGWQVVTAPRVIAWLNRTRADGRGSWMTPPSARTQRLAQTLPLAAVFGYLGYLSLLLVQAGDLTRGAVAMLSAVASLALFVRAVVLGWRRTLELRIDATGVFTRRWRGTIPWEAIDFVVTPTDRERVVRLMTRPPLTALGLPRATREGGGFVTIRLSDSEAAREPVIAAMLKVRPDLRVAPWAQGGVVLPIHGATDVPDIVQVGS